MTNFWAKRQYFEDSTHVDDLAERGEILLLSKTFDIASPGTVAFALTCPETKDVQIVFYDIATSSEVVTAVLLEDPTSYTGSAAGVTLRNLNRNSADTTGITLESAESVVGGTEIAAELIGSGAKAGGLITMGAKVHTLKKNETYIMSFTNQGNQTTKAHLNLGLWEDPLSPPSLVTPE